MNYDQVQLQSTSVPNDSVQISAGQDCLPTNHRPIPQPGTRIILESFSCLWQRCWDRYLFFISYGLVWSTRAGQYHPSRLGVSQPNSVLDNTRRNMATLLEKGEVGL